MPDEEKTVELDTSLGGANVQLPEEEKEIDKTYENEVKKNNEEKCYIR